MMNFHVSMLIFHLFSLLPEKKSFFLLLCAVVFVLHSGTVESPWLIVPGSLSLWLKHIHSRHCRVLRSALGDIMMKIERRCFFLNGHKNKSWFCFLFQSFVAAFNSLVAPVETKPRVECSEQQLKKRQKFSSLSLCTVKCCSRRDIHRRLLKYLSHSSSCARHHSLYSTSLNEWKKKRSSANRSNKKFISSTLLLSSFNIEALWWARISSCMAFHFDCCCCCRVYSASFHFNLRSSTLCFCFSLFFSRMNMMNEANEKGKKNWESSDEILISKYINICMWRRVECANRFCWCCCIQPEIDVDVIWDIRMALCWLGWWECFTLG